VEVGEIVGGKEVGDRSRRGAVFSPHRCPIEPVGAQNIILSTGFRIVQPYIYIYIY
jgi:hypothetical protein